MQAHSDRAHRLAALASRRFDLLVVGGGITGCGIARDAALRGLSVALVEKDDFASGTSSRSSRLVHGGVRYLEHGHLHLVFESSAERRRLLELAPHLVRPLAFTWPVYDGDRIPRWKLGAGLMLYDALALFRNVGRHERLSVKAVHEREPMLATDGLRGGAGYYDASTNDARLTLANALAASEAGAVVVNHARAEERIAENGRVVGMRVRDALHDAPAVEVRAGVVVNATGPWSGDIRGSKGAHIAVPRDRVGNNEALTLLAPTDGRVFFVLPGDSHAIIGTTETLAPASPDEVRASNEEVRYLIDGANHFFPRAALTPNDVVAGWAGIRPLVPAAGSVGSASREHAITVEPDGVVTITGGKLTTYRLMAAEVVDAALRQLGRRSGGGSSARTPLPGGDIDSMDALLSTIARETNDVQLATHLASYGSRWRQVWAECAHDGARRAVDDLPYTFGELRHGVRAELALTIADLLMRRTQLAFQTRDHGASVAEAVARELAPLLGWDADEQRRAVDDYAREARRVFTID
jgi:glycerol-3-phosphate dehydrogenase